jgi:hypothetical protein
MNVMDERASQPGAPAKTTDLSLTRLLSRRFVGDTALVANALPIPRS